MLIQSVVEKIFNIYENKPLVVEGGNGSVGLSLSVVLAELKVKPSKILLTTHNSAPHKHWVKNHGEITHLRSSDPTFKKERKEIIGSFRGDVNVIYGAGYGRPNMFLADSCGVISSNVVDLMDYAEFDNISTLAYMSTSELYTGSAEKVTEDTPLLSTPQHPRGVYIEAKRLGESIVSNILKNNVGRVAAYRVALATPPIMLENDGRVLADLINCAIKNKFVRLKGGAQFIRQYQYGPNSVYKILGSLVNGTSVLYNNAGSHILTLGELAAIISNIFNVPLKIEERLEDSTSPRIVLIDTARIDREAGYISSKEKNFEQYIKDMIYA
jgi:nucleoside-diphosphate-sugar epimerase